MTSSKSPRDVMILAWHLGHRCLPEYSSFFSRKDFTLPQMFACLVLRHCFQLTEYEVAETLGVSVGTVKSQTSKAVAQFRQQLGDAASAVADTLQAEAQAAGGQGKGSHAG